MDPWIDPRERKLLVQNLHTKYRKGKHEKEEHDANAKKEKIDNLWRDACEKGRGNGEIILCWRDLSQISNRVYTFEADYNRELHRLVLDGIELSNLGDIPRYCGNLKHLSLASNSIKDINDIHLLRKLSHLNLLRNHLSCLPPTLGGLTNLTRLEIANNVLVELPEEIGNLRGLKHINLECNELTELPVTVGFLRCEVLILNSNKFTVCPVCILSMNNLRQLSISSNLLSALPSGMGKFTTLEVLRASNNRLTVLPDSIVEVTSLRCLWLDFNKLSAIPPYFHRLTRLQELKLEGNVDMVYPPIQKVAMGVEEVLRWSRNRLEMNKSARVRLIVQSLGEVLSQVQRYKIGGPLHDSIFEVVDEQFQFPPNVLWDVFIPDLVSKIWSNPTSSNEGLNAFPYEREEVEQALFGFRDAAGPVVKRIANAKFRRCSCMLTRQSTQVCIPPKIGYMCVRPALLVRVNMAYEENMREKRRLRAEDKRVADAVKEAETVARRYLESEEGVIMVYEEVERRIAEMTERQRKTYKKKPETIISSMHATIKSSVSHISSQLQGTQKAKLKQIEEEIKEEYIKGQISKSTISVLDGNKKIRWIMKSWMGLSIDDAFNGWRDCVKAARRRKRREAREKLLEERLQYEDECARYELEKLEVSNFEKKWDEFNDCWVWIHSGTNETCWEEPAGPEAPLIPKSIIDPTTGELLSPRVIQQYDDDSSVDNSVDISVRSSTDHCSTLEVSESNEDETSRVDAPRGRDAELELAANRVMEIRKRQLASRYF